MKGKKIVSGSIREWFWDYQAPGAVLLRLVRVVNTWVKARLNLERLVPNPILIVFVSNVPKDQAAELETDWNNVTDDEGQCVCCLNVGVAFLQVIHEEICDL